MSYSILPKRSHSRDKDHVEVWDGTGLHEDSGSSESSKSGNGGGGGSDCGVNDMSLAIRHHSLHLIMGAVSLWTRLPRPCTCVQGPKNFTSAVQETPSMQLTNAQSLLQTETSRPDRRTATAGLHSFLHVDTGHLSSATTGM